MSSCLVEYGTRFDQRLLKCIKEGENDKAKSILQNVKDLRDSADLTGSTLLHYSAEYGNAVMVQYLIDEGCEIKVQDDYGVTPLMLAVKSESVTTVKVLLKNNADIYVADHNGMCSLLIAFHCLLRSPATTKLNEQNCYFIVEALFDKINKDFSTDKCRRTQLLLNANDTVKLAAVAFGNGHLASFVLENGYEIDYSMPESGYTALHCAVIYAKIENTKILIEHGANVNALDQAENKPIRYYTYNFESFDEQSKMLESLLKCTISSESLTHRINSTDVEHLLRQGNKRTVKTVLQSGIDVHILFPDGRYLLHLLTENENADVIDLLDELNIKFDINSLTTEKDSALEIAAVHGCLRKVEFLLKHRAHANSVISLQIHHSVLFVAALNSFTTNSKEGRDVAKIVELLLQHGAETQVVCSDGKTVVDCLPMVKDYPSSKVIIAHLAMLGALSESPLTDPTRQKIKNDPSIKMYFDSCTQQLEEMKKLEVDGIRVALFQLLTEPDEKKIVAYARNQEFMLAFRSALENMPHVESYFSNTLQKRVANSRNQVELEQKAATAFEALTGLCSDTYFNVVSKIFSYLNPQDLQNLCEVGHILLTRK